MEQKLPFYIYNLVTVLKIDKKNKTKQRNFI